MTLHQILRTFLFILLFSLNSIYYINAQCPHYYYTNPNPLFSENNCLNLDGQVVTCRLGESVKITNIVNGAIYRFVSGYLSNDNYITVRDFNTGVVIAFGYSPLNVTNLNSDSFIVTILGGESCFFDIYEPIVDLNMRCLYSPNPILNTIQPPTTMANAGAVNVEIMKIRLTGCELFNFTQLRGRVPLSSNFSTNINSIKLYFTLSYNTFDTLNFVGSTNNVLPNGIFDINTNLDCPQLSEDYTDLTFWVTYDLKCNANVGDSLDLLLVHLIINNLTIVPNVNNPIGKVAIGKKYVPIQSDGNGSINIHQGAVNERMAVCKINKANACPPNVSKIKFNISGQNILNNTISSVKCYYTKTKYFNDSIVFGIPLTVGNGNHEFVGNINLENGDNYFWLVFDISCTASMLQNINGRITNVVIGNTDYVTLGQTPVSNPIVSKNDNYYSKNDGNWNQPTTWSCGIIPTSDTHNAYLGHEIELGDNTICGNLTILQGGELKVEDFDLTLGASSQGPFSGFSNKTFLLEGKLNVLSNSLNINGAMHMKSSATFNMLGGELVLDPNDGNASTSAMAHTLMFDSIQNNHLNLSGGIIKILDPPFFSYYSSIFYEGDYKTIAINDLILGTGDDTNTGNLNGFYLNLGYQNHALSLGDVFINGGRYSDKRHVSIKHDESRYATRVNNININMNAELVIGFTEYDKANLVVAGYVNNNGVLSCPNTLTFAADILINTFEDDQHLEKSNIGFFTGTGLMKLEPTHQDPTNQSGNIIESLSVSINKSTGNLALTAPLTVNSLNIYNGSIVSNETNILSVGHGNYIPGNPEYLNSTYGNIYSPAISSFIIGPLRRFKGSTTFLTSFKFPVGDTLKRAVQLDIYPNQNIGYITINYTSSPVFLELSDVIIEPNLMNQDINYYGKGIVDIQTNISLSYDISITDPDFIGLNDFLQSTLIKRNNLSSMWTLDGQYYPTLSYNPTNTYLQFKRNQVITSSCQFAVGFNEANISQNWYIDQDGDHYGGSAIFKYNRPLDGYNLEELLGIGTDDCDDMHALVFPNSTFVKSYANGNWDDPNVWLCGSPSITSDSILIENMVSLNITPVYLTANIEISDGTLSILNNTILTLGNMLTRSQINLQNNSTLNVHESALLHIEGKLISNTGSNINNAGEIVVKE